MFEGIGCLATPYHISVDSSIQPVVCPLRNQPVALRERLKEELDYMESIGVIKTVEMPTDWVNSLVITNQETESIFGSSIPQQSYPKRTLSASNSRGHCNQIIWCKMFFQARCQSRVLANPSRSRESALNHIQ